MKVNHLVQECNSLPHLLLWILAFVCLQIIVATELLKIGKENPLLGHMLIINRINLCTLWKGKISICSICQHVHSLCMQRTVLMVCVADMMDIHQSRKPDEYLLLPFLPTLLLCLSIDCVKIFRLFTKDFMTSWHPLARVFCLFSPFAGLPY
jgi:hypothetical protein